MFSSENSQGNKVVFEPDLLQEAKRNGIYMDWEANGLRLPTGNEWEIAARGGLKNKKYPWGDQYPGTQLANWYVGPGMPNSTTEVGSYLPNGFGLFDMAGGVSEFVWDDKLVPEARRISMIKDNLTIRGGTWNSGWKPEVSFGSEIRLSSSGPVGFRIVKGSGFLPERGAPVVGAPEDVPGGLVNYIALLVEVRKEIVAAESELLALLEEGRKKESEVKELKGKLKSLEEELAELNRKLKACEESGGLKRAELSELENRILSKEMELIAVKGELSGVRKSLKDADCEVEKVEERMEYLKKEMKESDGKLKTAHTPGWHYAPGYGWLWTSPKHYPQIYSNSRQGWVYYEQGTSEPWLYYDYGTQQWEEWFVDGTLFSSSN